ncbi:predicted protein [Uncinocarpus reesii 1704]|uniref:Uncharacterized protein n=1 Tax=Uncinocarpus reesii (strain UAMH 1704) TaxID=336963 RepID=C4JN69_UNCRE|nr:uncharacterized protein UREG_04277 [Uncinocarpus reesii 1704]EEP79431.1 predicted protein [Uncinocarpus reesii 1704]
MTFMGSMKNSLLSRTTENNISLAILKFDFSLFKVEAPVEFEPLGSALSCRRRDEAENGPQHQTARRLAALQHEPESHQYNWMNSVFNQSPPTPPDLPPLPINATKKAYYNAGERVYYVPRGASEWRTGVISTKNSSTIISIVIDDVPGNEEDVRTEYIRKLA